MKKIILLCFYPLFFSATVYAQQFSQYNTETLFDSFENPSQRSFIRDSSNMYASNFFFPNFGGNAIFLGNGQRPIRARIAGEVDNSDLQINQGKFNHINASAGAYLFMFKMYNNLKGDQEIGFSVKFKVEGRGLVSDETVAFLNTTSNFTNEKYDNIINNKANYQNYYQIGFSYREKVTKRLALGAKFNILLGVQHQKLDINESHIVFDSLNTNATVGLRATYQKSYVPGQRKIYEFMPSLRNPGASVSFGGSYKSESGLIWQGNVKDLGFIHWSNRSQTISILDSRVFTGLKARAREDSIKNQAKDFLNSGQVTQGSYITPTDGLAELSVSKPIWLNYDRTFKILPTLIVQKQLFYPSLIGALVNHVQYNRSTLTITSYYNDLRVLSMGGQYMYKTPNAEFFIGSERLLATSRIVRQQVDYRGPYLGGDFFIGFSLKFGAPVESRMNVSRMPMGEEKGLLGRLYDKVFGKKPKGEL